MSPHSLQLFVPDWWASCSIIAWCLCPLCAGHCVQKGTRRDGIKREAPVCLGPTQHAEGSGVSFPSSFFPFISLYVSSKLKNTSFPIKVLLGSLEAAEKPYMDIGQSTQLSQVQRRTRWLMWGCTDTLTSQGKQIQPEGFSESLVWDLSIRSEWKSAMLQKNGFLLKYPFIIYNGCVLSIENGVSSKCMLEYGNIFSGDTLPCSCSCKGPGWFSLALSPVQGHALCLEFCSRDWPCVRGIQGGKVCQTHVCVHMHTLTQILLQSCCFGFNLPLELEEAARGCNDVQQESVSMRVEHEASEQGQERTKAEASRAVKTF